MSIPKIRSIFVLKNKPIKKIRQIVRWFIAFMIGGYVFLLFIVSYGPFHDYLLHAVTREIHANLGAECHVEAVSLGLFNRIVLDDVKLYDQAHAPLLFCQKISVKFNPVSILNGDIEIYNAEIINDTIGIATYDVQSKDTNLVCAKVADELLTISNITASFALGNLGDKICISGRSIGDINVQVILEKLGGGGHITLAGAQMEGVTLEQAKQELISRINEYFAEIG